MGSVDSTRAVAISYIVARRQSGLFNVARWYRNMKSQGIQNIVGTVISQYRHTYLQVDYKDMINHSTKVSIWRTKAGASNPNY